jgi:hypothetical protein
VFPDKVETLIVKEYAQGLAQFRAGNIYAAPGWARRNQTA